MERIIEIENIIDYHFSNEELLREAFTHSSKGELNSQGNRFDYERLEFVGDAMLDAIIGAMLYLKLPSGREGELSKLRAQIVCEESLDIIGKGLGLNEFILVGEGEERASGRNKPSVVSDVVEATIGAIYLDGGFDEVKYFVERVFSTLVEDAIEGKLFRDYKTKLQELAQKNNWHIEYRDDEEGPDHDKTFFSHLYINGKEKGYGIGKNKKAAEQSAAESFLGKA